MPWTPLLDGELAASATVVVRDLALALATQPQTPASAADRTTFWAYASSYLDEPFAHAAYDAALDELVAHLRTTTHQPSLYDGLAGIGWTLGHVLDADAEDLLATIDEVLLGVLAVETWSGNHDLIRGLVGLGVYFLERGPAPRARDGLARVVDHLARAATTTDQGTTWHTSPALLPDAVAWPEGRYDCGVAHGVPGIVALLARAAAEADAPPRARPLCEDAIRWVLAQRDLDGRFPALIAPARPRDQARTAWCYGEPGIAAALWSATSRLAISDERVRQIALDGARREVATCRVTDAHLCHGAAGLAHLYNRLFQASGDAELGDAARAWFARTLDMERGGLVADLLEGSIGTGLALLGAVTATTPSWDRLLLCDVPPA